jgi:Nif-specific regulatory protein
MKPRLVVIDGPLAGKIFALDRELKTIGRGPTNDVDLFDLRVSQRHCCVELKGDEVAIVDLGSRNGTFVNTEQVVGRKTLREGDEVHIGNTTLVFLTDDSFSLDSITLSHEHKAHYPLETVELIPSDTQYLRPTLTAEAASKPRIARDLSVLLHLSAEINAIRESHVLQQTLLERILEIVPAEQGAIRLADERQTGFASTMTRQRNAAVEAVNPSETITHRVLDRGTAVLQNDVLQKVVDPSHSMIAMQIQSVLCVPLVLFEKKLGVIYLDTREAATPFDLRHLELLTAIASIGAVALEHVRYVEWLETENSRLDDQIHTQYGLIGDGRRMREVKRMISHAARAGSTATITGESGTGKELVAWAIHRHGPRAKHRFVPVNCGAIPKDLVESELFGHKRGAFSGADRDRKGHFEEASGGTIFLDEVADLPFETQVKLLRVLSSHEVIPLGSSQSIPIDVQVIAATNRSLENLVETKLFREDLFYRLNVLRIKTPALRERKEDIPALVSHFFQKYRHKAGRELLGTHPDFMKALTEHNWPGNIRELENAIEYAIVIGEADRLRPEDLPPSFTGVVQSSPLQRKFYAGLEEASRQIILEAFRTSESGTYPEVGELLGLHENLLHRKVTELGIRSEVDQVRHKKSARRHQN